MSPKRGSPLGGARAHAPGSVGNIGPGLDIMGMALAGPGDSVEVRLSHTPGVVVQDSGHPDLPKDPGANTAALAAQAAPVVGEVLPLRQPDGATIQVRIWGDEFYTVVESLDGYTLIRDPQTGYVCYAGLSDDGDTLWSTGVAMAPTKPEGLDLAPHIRINPEAAAAQARAARADFEKRRHEGPYAPRDGGGEPRGPTQGNVQGICLIVDFYFG